jgi:hypothetical protein
MTVGDEPLPSDRPPPADAAEPRAVALADYLRRCAAAFSMSADVTDVDSTAEAGMALLDAAAVAEALSSDDGRIRILSEAGLFESMPDGEARFLETPQVSAAIRRTLVSAPQGGEEILSELVAAVAPDEPRDEE